MKIYLAPLENITTHVYRNTIYQMYGDYIDTYFMPFFMPHIKISLDEKDRRQLSRQNNLVKHLIPQILTDDSQDFWRMAQGIIDLGYREININIGCPSRKVASKGRGAGLLERKDQLNRFLEGVFQKKPKDVAISVKTRLGTRNPEEFYEILAIYNQYPMKELILHPRTGVEKYQGIPHKEYFVYALKNSRNPLCYNGNIYTRQDYCNLMHMAQDALPNISLEEKMTGIMIGRGILANPALVREIQGGPPASGEEMLEFLNLFRENSCKIPRPDQEAFLLNKSKEIWSFMRVHYEDRVEEVREIFLTRDYKKYLRMEEQFFLR